MNPNAPTPPPSPAAPPRAGRARLWRQAALWALFPLLALLACEALARIGLDRPKWYALAEREAASHRIDFLFIGSSRVAASIDIPTFCDVMSRQWGRPVYGVNLGMGNSSPKEHALGLRHLFEEHPASMRGCAVLFEAPGGVFTMGDWNGAWFDHSQPQIIIPVLRARDLPQVWRSPATPLLDKLHITALYAGGRSMLFARREFIRQSIMEKGAKTLLQTLVALRLAAPGGAPREGGPAADLTTAGGIRANAEGVRQARELALKGAAESARGQKAQTDWRSPVFDETRRLIEAHGGRAALFLMPESSAYTRLHEDEAGRQSRAAFERQFPAMGALMLRPAFRVTDGDFPDMLHLRKSRAPEFSAALARAYVQATSATLTRP